MTERIGPENAQDPLVVKDDRYWKEVKRALGRGAPFSLLGTSGRALKRSLEKLRAVSEGTGKSATSATTKAIWRRPRG